MGQDGFKKQMGSVMKRQVTLRGGKKSHEYFTSDAHLIEKLRKGYGVKGLEKEPLDKQLKYLELYGERINNGQDITFTGMYKYVDSGLTDKFNLPIYKRKRIFRNVTRVQKFLTGE